MSKDTNGLRYDWVESQANRLASEECCLSEAEIAAEGDLRGNLGLDEAEVHPEGDRALNPVGKGIDDPLQRLLERTWGLLNKPVFHSHYCCRCQRLRVCYQKPCKYRATDLEREWECGCQHG